MELTDQILESDLDLTGEAAEPESPREPAPQMPAAPKTRKKLRPEAVIGLIAVMAALILTLTIVVCLPYMGQQDEFIPLQTESEDPLLEQLTGGGEEDPEKVMSHEAQAETLPSIEPIEEPQKNPYGPRDFQYDKNNYLYCLRQESYPGVDVSAFQANIDWQKVKDSGIRFAMLRLGYRGYESGKLVEDEYIQQNLKATKEVGMPIGAYFFSQALTVKEVDEEIDFMLKVLGDYELHMPIVLDWEIPTADARTAQMDARTLTALQEYFCKTMTEKGFTPMVYFNWHQSNTLLYLTDLEAYPFWLALYDDRMTYPYHVEMWQYTSSGKVPGIQGGVDINVYMPKEP